MNTTNTAQAAPVAHSRAKLLSEILELNPTTDLGYLNSFSDDELAHYRDHLMHGQQPRGEATPWVRRGNSRAVSFRDSDI